jgi:hypothetical protein
MLGYHVARRPPALPVGGLQLIPGRHYHARTTGELVYLVDFNDIDVAYIGNGRHGYAMHATRDIQSFASIFELAEADQ